MFLAYRILTNFLYPFFILIIFFRKFLKKEDAIRYKEKIFRSHFNVKRKVNKRLIWFHAASIGEFKSILPIIEELDLQHKDLEFLITTNTLSSSNLLKDKIKKINVSHRFFPLDVIFLIRNFLILWKPSAIFLVDSEIWPNLILEAKKNNIPVAIINARITTKSFNRWMIFRDTANKLFSSLNFCFASNMQTKDYLTDLKVRNVYFNGNLKFYNKINKNKIFNINEKFLSATNFWIAASTHEPEEFFCLKAHLELKKNIKNLVTIIAPRHINRARKIKSLSESLNLNTQILNKDEKILNNKEVIILNTFGELQNYFEFAKSVFIGKSITKRLKNEGGQNPIDAAFLNCKIYHGPFVYNFIEVYQILAENKISKEIKNFKELANYLADDFTTNKNENREFSHIIDKLGQKTFKNTMEFLNKFINNDFK